MTKKCRIISNNSGVVAIESALLFPIIFFILLAILETTYVFIISIVLEGATSEAGRQIKTRSFDESVSPQQSFEDVLCSNMVGLVKCNELIIAVTKFEEFSSIERPEIDPDRNPQFRPGNPGDIILVRVLYNYDFITPGLGTALMNQTGTSIKPIISNIVFRNEPL